MVEVKVEKIPVAELLERCGCGVEAADIRSDHRHPEKPEIENGGYGVSEIVPVSLVIPRPMGRISAGADESRPGEHERPLAAGRPEQRLVGGDGLGEAIQAVRIVF